MSYLNFQFSCNFLSYWTEMSYLLPSKFLLNFPTELNCPTLVCCRAKTCHFKSLLSLHFLPKLNTELKLPTYMSYWDEIVSRRAGMSCLNLPTSSWNFLPTFVTELILLLVLSVYFLPEFPDQLKCPPYIAPTELKLDTQLFYWTEIAYLIFLPSWNFPIELRFPTYMSHWASIPI